MIGNPKLVVLRKSNPTRMATLLMIAFGNCAQTDSVLMVFVSIADLAVSLQVKHLFMQVLLVFHGAGMRKLRSVFLVMLRDRMQHDGQFGSDNYVIVVLCTTSRAISSLPQICRSPCCRAVIRQSLAIGTRQSSRRKKFLLTHHTYKLDYCNSQDTSCPPWRSSSSWDSDLSTHTFTILNSHIRDIELS